MGTSSGEDSQREPRSTPPTAPSAGDGGDTSPARGTGEPALRLPPLTRIGRYELVEPLGHGGMGVVYRAHDSVLRRDVAMKVLPLPAWVRPDARQRFENEARAAAALEHPNIVRVHDVGALPAEDDGLPFYTMELLQGSDMRQAIGAGSLSVRDAVEATRQIALALSYAHHHRILHRDVKPHNIFLRRAEASGGGDSPTTMGPEPAVHALLLDFGLAKLTEGGGETRQGASFGTPQYMPPEQIRDARSVDARADVYGLGATLYHALAGRPPFEGDEGQVRYSVLKREPARPRSLNPRVDRDLETVCLKCLAKEPRDRYQTAGELAEDCRRYLAGEPIAARPVGPVRRMLRRARRNRLVSAMLACMLVLAGVAAWTTLSPAQIAFRTIPADAQAEAIDARLWRGRWVWPPRAFTLRVRARGYSDAEVPVTVAAGKTTRLGTIALERDSGTLSVMSTPPGAVVLLDDRPLQHTTPMQGAEVPKGDHVLTLRLPDYEDHVRSVTIRGGAQTVIRDVKLTHRTGKLALDGCPRGMTVLVRGARGAGTETKLSPPVTVPLDTGEYELIATAEGRFGRSSEIVIREGQTTPVSLSLGRHLLWSCPVGDIVGAQASFGDLDGDGVPDCVVGSSDNKVYAISGRDGSVLWTYETEAVIGGSPALVDLDADGGLDCVFGSFDGWVYAVSGSDGHLLWKCEVGALVVGSPAVGDLDSDGVPDVVVATELTDMVVAEREHPGANGVHALSGRDGAVMWTQQTQAQMLAGPTLVRGAAADAAVACVFAAGRRVSALAAKDGKVLWGHETAGQAGSSPPLVGDLDADGVPECVVAANDDGVYALSSRDGSVVWRQPLKGKLSVCPALGDVDGDGSPDCIVRSDDKMVYALSGRRGVLLWGREVDGQTGQVPAMADVDGDGLPDCVIGAADGLYCALSGEDGKPLWSRPTGGISCFSAAMVDLNGDGVADCVIGVSGSDDHRICAFEGGDVGVLWARKVSDAPLFSCALGDIKGQGVLDCVAGSDDWSVYVLSGPDGSFIWQQKTDALSGGTSTPGARNGMNVLECALGDLDGDGVLDCVAASLDGNVYALDGVDGHLLWRFKTEAPVAGLPSLADLDGDGRPECVVASRDGYVYAIEGRSGQKLWRWGNGDAKAWWSTPLVADLNGDKAPACLVASMSGGLYALAGKDGHVLWSRPEMPGVAVDPALADLDGDGAPDCLVPANDGLVHALDGRSGRELWKWGDGDALAVWSSPAVADLDGDGTPDCVVSGGTVYALSGKDGHPMWSHVVQHEGTGGGAVALGDVDGDGVPDCITLGVHKVIALSGVDGHTLWEYETPYGIMGAPILATARGNGQTEIATAWLDGFVQVLRPPLQGRPFPADPISSLHALRRAQYWNRLAAEAERIGREKSSDWARSIALMHLGIARLRLGDARAAMDAFAHMREVRLRAPDAAVFEWVASCVWRECPADRRAETERLLLEALSLHADDVVDTFVDASDLLPDDAGGRLKSMLEHAATDADTQIARAILLSTLLTEGVPGELASAAEKQVLAKLGAAQGKIARWQGYLAILAHAQGDRERFRRADEVYQGLPHRPESLDALLRAIPTNDSLLDIGKPLADADEAMRRGDYAAARALYDRALAGRVSSDAWARADVRNALSTAYYNLGCIYSLLSVGKPGPKVEPHALSAEEAAKHRDNAFKHLQVAVSMGDVEAKDLAEDPDLVPLHGDPRWKGLTDRLKK